MVLPILFNVHNPALDVLQEEEQFLISCSKFLHLDGLALLSVGGLQGWFTACVKGWDALTIACQSIQPLLTWVSIWVVKAFLNTVLHFVSST